MVSSCSKWINVAIATFVVLALSVFTFTDSASAAVINSYATISNSRNIDTSVNLPSVSAHGSATTSNNILLGKCLIDGVFYSDFVFNASYLRNLDGSFLLNLNYTPMYAKYDNDTSVFKITEFSGFTVSFYLPQYLGSNNFSSVYEWVPITIGGNYGANYSNLFLTQYKPSVGIKAYNWSSSDYTTHHFALESTEDPTNGAFTGSYSSYNNSDRFLYVCQSLSYLLGYDSSIRIRTSVAFDINYFPDVLSYAEKEQLKKLDNISGDLDKLLNTGAGEFDDTKTDMDNITDKIDKDNEILENEQENRPSKDDVDDMLSEVIDNVLSNPEGSTIFNSIMGMLFSQNIILMFISVSIGSGVIKYIFFGKG